MPTGRRKRKIFYIRNEYLSITNCVLVQLSIPSCFQANRWAQIYINGGPAPPRRPERKIFDKAGTISNGIFKIQLRSSSSFRDNRKITNFHQGAMRPLDAPSGKFLYPK